MTEEEAKRFEKELMVKISKMTGKLTDPPRFQLTGELIPPEILRDEKKPGLMDVMPVNTGNADESATAFNETELAPQAGSEEAPHADSVSEQRRETGTQPTQKGWKPTPHPLLLQKEQHRKTRL